MQERHRPGTFPSDIRVAHEEADGDGICTLLRSCGLSATGLFSPSSVVLVAVRDGTVIGTCGLEIDGAAGLLRSLAVDQSARETGLSRRLTGVLIDHARRRGVLRLFTFSKDRGDYFVHHGWRDVPLADAVPQIENTAQVRRYHAVGWYADERALRLDL